MCQMHIGFAGQGTQAKHLSHNAAYREQTRLIQIQIWSCGYIQILFYQSNCWDILISSQAVQECVCSSICFFLNTNNITQTVSNIIRVELRSLFLWCQSQDYVATLWSPKRPCKCLLLQRLVASIPLNKSEFLEKNIPKSCHPVNHLLGKCRGFHSRALVHWSLDKSQFTSRRCPY